MHATIASTASASFYFRLMAAFVVAILALLALVLFGSAELVGELTREGGPVETMAAAGYLVAIATFFREGGFAFARAHIYFPLILAAMFLRELDFHNLLTTMSITKTRFYVSPDVPLVEKLLAVIAIGLLAWAGIAMLRRHARQFLLALKAFHPVAIAIAAAGASVVAAKSLDGLPRKMEALGFDLAADAALVSNGIEEVIELGIPVFLAIAVYAFFGGRRAGGDVAKRVR